jgi:hypothetical protein
VNGFAWHEVKIKFRVLNTLLAQIAGLVFADMPASLG